MNNSVIFLQVVKSINRLWHNKATKQLENSSSPIDMQHPTE